MAYATPLTEEERVARHFALTGETLPPPRGTRRAKLTASSQTYFWVLLALHVGLIGLEVYIAWKEGWI